MKYRPYGLTRAQCRYYLRDSRMCVSCVSAEESADAQILRFDSETAKRRYMERHCLRRDCGGCETAKMLRRCGL